MARLYNHVGIANSLLIACELQIRKNGLLITLHCALSAQSNRNFGQHQRWGYWDLKY